MGNRELYTVGTGSPLYYCTNNLNQYEATDDDPNNCPSPSEDFDYDEDGNLTEDGTYQYAWDAENRLVLVEPASSPVNGDKKLEFGYDYMGRRVQKKVYTHNGSQWNLTLERRFVWADWLMLLELDGSNDTVRKYTWGLDLSGTFQDAGGIGGLLATRDVSDPNSPESHVYFHDANGNVGQLIDLFDGSVDAKYEYDPYGGNLLDPDDPNESGPYAAENPFRFSTKYFDAETALGYWGYRYYSPRLGRWLNRDPLGEPGAVRLAPAAGGRSAQPRPSHLTRRPNLFAYIGNAPALAVDALGLRRRCPCDPPPGVTCPPTMPPCEPESTGVDWRMSVPYWKITVIQIGGYLADLFPPPPLCICFADACIGCAIKCRCPCSTINWTCPAINRCFERPSYIWYYWAPSPPGVCSVGGCCAPGVMPPALASPPNDFPNCEDLVE